MFKKVNATFNLPKMEHKILKFWEELDALKKRCDLNEGGKHWSFIDGPITANNPMGVHHAWGRTYKDVFQRYRAMRGYKLRYQNGFDCQGLWVEVEVEKELGFGSKRDIEVFGIQEFVKKCKQRVLHYAAIQVEQSIRLGYWMDWDDPLLLRELVDKMECPENIVTVNGPMGPVTDSVEQIVAKLGTPQLGGSYFTFSNENNYTIWTVLKKCHNRGWIYKGRDVMPWCPRCSTALSQHEIVTEGYRELVHPGLTVKFPLRGRTGEALLIWTTTPWTLTSNVAVAVHPDMTYVKIRYNKEKLYLSKAVFNRIFKDKYSVLEELKGQMMQGWKYDGPFDELYAVQKLGVNDVHRVILWAEVSEEEGTGIVHIAPGCGKEDFKLGNLYNLSAIAPLDEFGIFNKGFDWFTGIHVYDSAKPVIENLRKKGLLFNVEDYSHRYPVCWRCGNELIFRLVDEWFISVGKKIDKPYSQITEDEKKNNLRFQMMEVTKHTRWIPDFGLQQELDWLRNMDDWMISKKRFWGLALPIWECKKCGAFDVIGSEEELKSRAVEGWEEFSGHTPHRPWIDAVKILCPECGDMISRIRDVGNPWLDAGIVAYSTLNYRVDKDYWRSWFPADLICESLPGQFRNWFYSMLVMSTIMEQKPPFLTCFGHGLVLAENGREMHKSWGNTIWFDDAVEIMGADVMRWMYCFTKPESNLLFGYSHADMVKRRFIIPLWNVYSFFVIYANLDQWEPNNILPEFSILDRWVLSKLQVLVKNVTKYLEDYDPFEATVCIERFVDELSKWYIRRSRRRFWKSEKDEDKNAGYTTLYTCLSTLVKLLAPFIPFLTEEIYQNLVVSVDSSALESVHFNSWPMVDESLIDDELMSNMNLAIKISGLGRSARNKAGIKLRQPLNRVSIVAEKAILKRIQQIIDLVKDELNVKEILLISDKKELVEYEIRLLPHLLGKKHGRLFSKLSPVLSKMDTNIVASAFENGLSVDVDVAGKIITLLPEEVEVSTRAKTGYILMEENDICVGVDITITEELKTEGLARDIVRRIQSLRKEADFNIADKIITYYVATTKLTDVFVSHREYITTETLSKELKMKKPPKESQVGSFEIDGEQLTLGLTLVHT